MTYRLQGKNNAFIALPVCFSVRPCVASRDKLLSSRCPDFISSTFWRSHEDDDAWINTLLENLHTRPACWSFVVSGDFNALPNEVSDSLALSVAYVQDSSGAPSPSRWKGNRCIEFAAHTPDLNLVRCRYLDTVLSDHKVFAGHLEVTGHWQGACQLTSTPTLCKPHHVQDTEWRSKQEPEWLQVQIPSPSTTEQEWQEFHSQAERAAVTALGQFSAHRPPPQKRTAVRLKSRPSLDLRKCRTKAKSFATSLVDVWSSNNNKVVASTITRPRRGGGPVAKTTGAK
jgi:hypothetical protein